MAIVESLITVPAVLTLKRVTGRSLLFSLSYIHQWFVASHPRCSTKPNVFCSFVAAYLTRLSWCKFSFKHTWFKTVSIGAAIAWSTKLQNLDDKPSLLCLESTWHFGYSKVSRWATKFTISVVVIFAQADCRRCQPLTINGYVFFYLCLRKQAFILRLNFG